LVVSVFDDEAVAAAADEVVGEYAAARGEEDAGHRRHRGFDTDWLRMKVVVCL
jgi:hypothetical protein